MKPSPTATARAAMPLGAGEIEELRQNLLVANPPYTQWHVDALCHMARKALTVARSETERRNPWRFELDEQQAAKLEAWRKEQDAEVLKRQREDGADDPFIEAVHASGSPYYGAIGGELTFSFSPNSIGEVAKAKHGGTGAEIDLTDYDAW